MNWIITDAAGVVVCVYSGALPPVLNECERAHRAADFDEAKLGKRLAAAQLPRDTARSDQAGPVLATDRTRSSLT